MTASLAIDEQISDSGLEVDVTGIIPDNPAFHKKSLLKN